MTLVGTAQNASPGETYGYITNDDGTVSVINTANDIVIDTITVGNDPFGVAVTQDGKKVYVGDYKAYKVYAIDTITHRVTATVPVGKNPFGLAVTPDGKKAYVANEADNTVSVINTSSNHVSVVPVGKEPFGVAVTPDGKKVYVTNSGSNYISIIDTATDNVTSVVNGLSYPGGIAINPTGTETYVSSGSTNTLTVINTTSDTVIATVPVGNSPTGVAVNPMGTKMYVANNGSNSVSVIDLTTEHYNVIATVKVGHNPFGVDATPDGTKVYVANHGTNKDPGNTVTVINSDNTILTTVEVGRHPKAFGHFIVRAQQVIPIKSVLPIADFVANPTSGNAPLTVKFTDSSRNADEWSWTFGDGANSTDRNTSHVYSSAGNYTVNLTVSNANGTSSKPDTITVKSQSNSSGGSDGGGGDSGGGDSGGGDGGGGSRSSSSSSSSSGGGSGGGGGSPEPQTNVEVKEISQAFITNGSPVKFDFPQRVTPVVNISFNPKKTAGKTTTIVELLKAKSTLVTGVPSNEVYKYLNIWVGNSGFATEKNIENAVVSFKVAKSWVQDENIDKSSITLNRYNDMTWNQLTTSISGEDDKYLYLTTKTPGFSLFAITGKTTVSEAVNATQSETQIGPNIGSLENGASKPVNTELTHEQTQGINTSGNRGGGNTFKTCAEIIAVIVFILVLIVVAFR